MLTYELFQFPLQFYEKREVIGCFDSCWNGFSVANREEKRTMRKLVFVHVLVWFLNVKSSLQSIYYYYTYILISYKSSLACGLSLLCTQDTKVYQYYVKSICNHDANRIGMWKGYSIRTNVYLRMCHCTTA